MDDIFVVTSLKVNHVKNDIKRKKTQGWFKSFASAEDYILSNTDNMFDDGNYEHAVIETIEPGRSIHVIDESWYEAMYSYFDWGLYSIQPCAKPKAARGMGCIKCF